MVPPMAEAAVPTIAAATSPRTLRTRTNLKPGPNARSISHAASTASPALHTANRTALHEISVAEQIGDDGCGHRADNDRPARTRPESDQDAGRDTGGRPEHRNALRLGQQGKTLSRGHEIGDADDRGEDDQARPPRQVDAGGKPLKPSLLS